MDARFAVTQKSERGYYLQEPLFYITDYHPMRAIVLFGLFISLAGTPFSQSVPLMRK